ncbi:isopeptide-forming domain-containing fimbrial protein [Corynebacterium diphtheriae]|nr:isopeptide-forming domain-containing fimbrial protein [Corynebacterium diphtheriae]
MDPDATQPSFSVGENVKYRVATKIPEIAANTKFEGFTVADKLPAELGKTYQIGDRTVLSVQLAGATLQSLDQHKDQEPTGIQITP